MSAILSSIRPESPWRTALPVLVLLLAAIGVLFRDTAMVMAGIWWRSDTFAHCMLVLPISLWLVWRKRAELAELTPRPQPVLLLLMLLPALGWLLSQLVVVNAATQFAFVFLLILAVPAVLGIEVARVILFPLLFLLFAVPFGEFMLPTMMEWTADFTVAAVRFSGVPVFREGQNFSIPSGNWSVIDECSGVRYVMASFLVGSLFAYLNYASYRKRVIFMLVALALPVFANWLRAYMIVMIAHLSGNRLAVGVDHILYGWVFFGVIIFIMFMVGSRWADPDSAFAPAARSGVPAVLPGWMLPATALGVLAVVAAPHLVLATMERMERSAGPVVLELPAALGPSWSAGQPQVTYRSQIVNPSAEAQRAYAGPGGTVGLELAYFRGQDAERKLVNSQHLLVGMRDDAWALPVYTTRAITLDGQQARLRSAEVLDRGRSVDRQRLAVWRLYWIDGRYYTSDVRAKLAGALARLRGRGDEGALLTLHASQPTPAASEALLEAFVKDNQQALSALLAKVQGQR